MVIVSPCREVSVWLSHLRSSTVECAGGYGGWWWSRRVGVCGGLGVVVPLLADLMALSGPSDDLLFIWALRQFILSCVSLILLRGSRVSLALLSRLLMSRISCCCSINCLIWQEASSFRAESGICVPRRVLWSVSVSAV